MVKARKPRAKGQFLILDEDNICCCDANYPSYARAAAEVTAQMQGTRIGRCWKIAKVVAEVTARPNKIEVIFKRI